MKVFISQPMVDKTDEEIEYERKRMIGLVKDYYPNEEIEVIDSFFKEAPHDARPLWYLAQSLALLSTADVAVFAPHWNEYRGCKIEFTCATEYGIKTLELK